MTGSRACFSGRRLVLNNLVRAAYQIGRGFKYVTHCVTNWAECIAFAGVITGKKKLQVINVGENTNIGEERVPN
jgi:hypothetical protein